MPFILQLEKLDFFLCSIRETKRFFERQNFP